MKDIKNFINEGRRGRRWQGLYFSDLVQDLEEWWDDNYAEDCYNSHSEFVKDMKALAKKEDYKIINDAFDYLEDELRVPDIHLGNWGKDIIKTLVKWAEDAIK